MSVTETAVRVSLVSTTYRAARAVNGIWVISLSHSFIDLDKPASLKQILKFVSPDATATLLAPQTVSVISLAANASVSLGSQVNTVSAVRSTPLDSVRRVANVSCPVILLSALNAELLYLFRFVPFTIGLFLQLVTVTQKALSLLSARKTVVVSVSQALWELAVTCVRRTTSTTAPHLVASSVPTVTA